MKNSTFIAAASLAALLSACTHPTFNTERSELAAARAAIADARAANAEKCAPKLLASAQASLFWAAHELDEVGYHPEETSGLIAKAESDAKEAKAAAQKGCTPPPPPLDLKGVNFNTGSADLTEKSKGILDKVAKQLVGYYANINVEVAAHTDGQGNDASNQELSDRRAASVRAYLIQKGVAADRITSKGYGESKPIADNETAEGRAQNRRVELNRLN